MEIKIMEGRIFVFGFVVVAVVVVVVCLFVCLFVRCLSREGE